MKLLFSIYKKAALPKDCRLVAFMPGKQKSAICNKANDTLEL